MSFLRSVIADARSRKPMREQSAIRVWPPPGLGNAAFGIEEKRLRVSEPANRRSSPLHAMDSIGDDNMGDAPVPLGIQDRTSNPMTEGAPVVPVEVSGSISDEAGLSHLGTRHLSDQEPDPGGGRASKTGTDMPRQAAITPIAASRVAVPKVQSHDPSSTYPETDVDQDRGSVHEATEPLIAATSSGGSTEESSSGYDGSRTHQAQADPGQFDINVTTALATGEETRAHENPVETTVAVPRPHSESTMQAPEFPTSGADTKGTAAVATTKARRPIKFESAESGDAAEQDGARKAPANGAKATQPSPNNNGLGNMKRPFNRELPPQIQKRNEARGGFGRDQPLPRRVMAMDSEISSELKPVLVPRTAVKKAPAAADSPGPDFSPHGNPVPPMVGPANPAAGPTALRSVPARPFQNNYMPKEGHVGHARTSLGTPEKRTREPAAPKVKIGQIDVIIQAPPQSTTGPATVPSSTGMASRLYLRRL